MRVLHVGKYFPPFSGGIENFMSDLMHACARQGVEVSAVVHQSPRQAHDAAAPLEKADMPVLRVATYGQAMYAPISPGFGWQLARAIQRYQPQLLHLHLPNTSAFWLLWPGMARIPTLIHWHADVVGQGMDPRLRRFYPAYRPFEQALLRRADAIIATSPPYLHSSAALAPWQQRSQVIPLGLDRQRLAAAAADTAQWRVSGALKLLATGRLSRYKGFDLLIQAVLCTPGVELLIAGDGEERETLREQLRDAGEPACVRLLGRVSDAQRNRLMAGCDVFCLTSRNRAEAFGLVLLEAMALGKPALVTRVAGSGMAWVVQDGHSGWHVEAENLAALAAALAHIRDHRQQVQRYGAAARERFANIFDIDRVAQQTIALYQHVLARR
jgi:glycosyltransferase involved in cell wall biosynthesis